MTPATPDDVKVERLKLRGAVVLAVVGPLVTLACAVGYARLNHAQSEQGYAVLARLVNEQTDRVGQLTARVADLERHLNTARLASRAPAAAAPAKAAPDRAPLTLKAAQSAK